ncbi:hypothetical protein MCOR25_005588 [Pyricularia grisea]|nr:hypothetical protein MCOR25_005588 [Pyricularia grisea]
MSSDSSKPDGQRGWGLKNRSKNKVTSKESVVDTAEPQPADADDLSDVKPVEEIESDDEENDERRAQHHRLHQGEDGSRSGGRRSSKQHGRDLRKEFEKQTPKVGASVSAHDAYNQEPAYVAPIPKIPPIPPVASPGSLEGRDGKDRNGVPASNRPKIPRWVTERLIGKRIDEYGDIVDDDGKVLGRVAGDLPSMVGRTVLNQRGDILGDDGELLGYVAEVTPSKGKQNEAADDGDDMEKYTDEEDDGAPRSPPKSIDQYTGKSSASLQVDHRGNILDSYGNIIGHFRDNLRNPKTEAEIKAEERQQQRASSREQEQSGPSNSKTKEKPADDRPPNAAAWRKENESPSDIFLDVKSTTEGIQLTIRIPTVFPNGGTPRVNFS